MLYLSGKIRKSIWVVLCYFPDLSYFPVEPKEEATSNMVNEHVILIDNINIVHNVDMNIRYILNIDIMSIICRSFIFKS